MLIVSAGRASALYADVDGLAGFGPNDLAVAFIGQNAITLADIVF